MYKELKQRKPILIPRFINIEKNGRTIELFNY